MLVECENVSLHKVLCIWINAINDAHLTVQVCRLARNFAPIDVKNSCIMQPNILQNTKQVFQV